MMHGGLEEPSNLLQLLNAFPRAGSMSRDSGQISQHQSGPFDMYPPSPLLQRPGSGAVFFLSPRPGA